MTITIEPYTINSNIENSNIPLTYWGIYLDDIEISTTSTKEKAEKTKEWMENWLDTINYEILVHPPAPLLYNIYATTGFFL